MLINVKVYPKSKYQKIEKIKDGYKIHLLNLPEKGKANNELLKLLSDYFKISRNRMLIISGHKSKEKIISIKK